MSTIKPSYDERFIQQFIGTNMISNARVAIVELIANAWDAGARRVDIKWPVKSEDNAFFILGSGLIDYSQNMTVAAIAIADMNVCAHRS
jgi:hypothetical protein